MLAGKLLAETFDEKTGVTTGGVSIGHWSFLIEKPRVVLEFASDFSPRDECSEVEPSAWMEVASNGF